MKVVYHHSVGPWMKSRLRGLADSAGLEVAVVEPGDEKALKSKLSEVEVVWHVLEPFRKEDIESAPKLSLIHKFGVGVNTIDIDAASAQNIAVCNMPGSNSRAVAEATLNLILSCLRRTSWVHQHLATGGWKLPPNDAESIVELNGRTVGLIGYGDIPKTMAPILKAFGADILYTATSEKPDALGEFRDMDSLLLESDIVSLHVPLTEITAMLLDRGRLESMKPGAILINTARGGLVDQEALVDLLNSRHIACAGLDVLAQEPADTGDAILGLENVVLSPHIAWQTRETLERSIDLAGENCRRLRLGEPFQNQVNEF